MVSRCAVPAASARPRPGLTDVCVAVALTGAAAGEAPLAWLAVRALAPGGSLSARALTCDRVALVAHGAVRVAVTSCTGGKHSLVVTRLLFNIFKQ